MAKVFLSYVRDDEKRARSLAALLERAGHSVWWDRQIKGGTQYSAEIEAALNAADKIVVLWSAKSVVSAWVRDEAAVGRDTGRLVPVVIDRTDPPLGFRQFQTIDLSGWSGRAHSAAVQDLSDAIDTGVAARPTRGSIGSHSRKQLPRTAIYATTAAIMLIGLGFLVWTRLALRSAETPTIAVAAADSSTLSQQAASDLSIRVGQLGSETAENFQLVDSGAASASKAQLMLRVGAAEGGHRSLALLSKSGDMLWSASIERPSATSDDLAQQLAVSAERALSCTGESLSYKREPIGQGTLKLYLNACTSFDDAYGANVDSSAIANTFEQVIGKAPHFEPAWAKLFAVEVDEFQNVEDPHALSRTIANQVRKAQSLGLEFGELYAAKAASLSPADFLGIFRVFDDGIKRHPDNALLYRLRGERSMFVGRMNDSVGDTAHAAQLDPLSPANQQSLASSFAYSGNTDSAYAQLAKAEKLWPGAPTLVFARYRLDLRFGDPKEALSLLQQTTGTMAALRSEQAAFITARLDPTSANIDHAMAEDRKIYDEYPLFIAQYVQTLAQFGHKDEVLDILLNYKGGPDESGAAAEVLFRPAMREVWRDPRSIAAAAHLGLLHYWKVSGRWPDFCSDPSLTYDCRKEAAKYPV